MTIYCLFPVGSDSSAWLTTFERRASANLTNLQPVSNNAASLLDHSQATDLKSLWGTGSLQEYGCALSLSLALFWLSRQPIKHGSQNVGRGQKYIVKWEAS